MTNITPILIPKDHLPCIWNKWNVQVGDLIEKNTVLGTYSLKSKPETLIDVRSNKEGKVASLLSMNSGTVLEENKYVSFLFKIYKYLNIYIFIFIFY